VIELLPFSAASVQSPLSEPGRTAGTACRPDQRRGGRRLGFVPGYNHGKAPYGIYTARSSACIRLRVQNDFDYDYAFVNVFSGWQWKTLPVDEECNASDAAYANDQSNCPKGQDGPDGIQDRTHTATRSGKASGSTSDALVTTSAGSGSPGTSRSGRKVFAFGYPRTGSSRARP